MANPTRILILTADAGFGHRSAANAVAEALRDQYGSQVEVQIVNPLDDRRAPFFLRDSQSDYDTIVRNLPELYRVGFQASNETIPSAIAEVSLGLLLLPVMRDLIETPRPDAILTTYPIYQAPLVAAFITSGRTIPLYTVVTDLVSVHRLWFNPNVDGCMVPTEHTRALALENGLAADQISLTGIPVYPAIARETRSKAEIRADLGWRTDLPTILAVGSRRVEHLLDALNVLNHFGMPLQLAVVAGKDEQLYQKLQAVEWHQPTQLYLYSSQMATLMHAADAIICKAGGLVVTEALACGLPLLLIDVLPGQETGNAEYVVQGKAGDLVSTPVEFLENLAHLFDQDGALLRARAQAAQALGKPDAAASVARLVWQSTQHEIPIRRNSRHMRRLKEFSSQIRAGLKRIT